MSKQDKAKELADKLREQSGKYGFPVKKKDKKQK